MCSEVKTKNYSQKYVSTAETVKRDSNKNDKVKRKWRPTKNSPAEKPDPFHLCFLFYSSFFFSHHALLQFQYYFFQPKKLSTLDFFFSVSSSISRRLSICLFFEIISLQGSLCAAEEQITYLCRISWRLQSNLHVCFFSFFLLRNSFLHIWYLY